MSLTPQKSSAVPLPDGVIEYRNPTFDNRITTAGWACIAAMTAGGAYQGYRSDLKLQWTGWERKAEVREGGNAALGALAGLASSLLVTWIIGGEAPAVTTDNAALWLEKFDDRMMLLPSEVHYPGLPLNSIRGVAKAKSDASVFPGSVDEMKLSQALRRRLSVHDTSAQQPPSQAGTFIGTAAAAQGGSDAEKRSERPIAGHDPVQWSSGTVPGEGRHDQ